MKISVIVPTLYRPTCLLNCLDALKKQNRLPDEVIVVVYDEDWETKEALGGFREANKAISIKMVTVAKKGLTVAMNKGLELAGGDIACFTDDDTEARPDWLERIEKYYKDEKIGAVGGRDIQKGKEAFIKKVGILTWYGKLIGNHHLCAKGERECDCLKGCNLSFRKRLIKGIDENLTGSISSYSELDICFVIKKQGYKIIYDPLICVLHHVAPRYFGKKDKDERAEEALLVYESSYNYVYLLLKHLPLLRKIIFLAYIFLIGNSPNFGLFYFFYGLGLKLNLKTPRLFLVSLRGRLLGIRAYYINNVS